MTDEYYLVVGRANAGKTTYATKKLIKLLCKGKPAVLLDGDGIRNMFHNQDYSDRGRLDNINSTIYLAKKYMNLGIIPIIAMVCPKYSFRRLIAEELSLNGTLVYVEGGELWEDTEFEEPLSIENAIIVPPYTKKRKICKVSEHSINASGICTICGLGWSALKKQMLERN